MYPEVSGFGFVGAELCERDRLAGGRATRSEICNILNFKKGDL